ncbi:MAG: hypothetical protein DHS20C21_14740 [Gemmatimonadota bacterium]|nr:MAG: hypothetical protein DHS20C21_14740 [Gemmatimonadota bacterium]
MRATLLFTIAAACVLSASGSTSASTSCVDHTLYGIPRTSSPVNHSPEDLQLVGGLLYAATYNGLHIYQESSAGVFAEVGGVNTGGVPTGVHVAGSLAFVTAGSGGLHVIDVTVPETPVLLANAIAPWAQDVAVAGSHAYVSLAQGNGVVRVFDISDPNVPSIVTTWTSGLDGYAAKILAQDDLVYLATGSGLAIADLTDPLSPQLLGLAPTTGVASDLFLEGTLAYVASGESGLRIMDVSNPAAPFEVGALVLPEDATWVAVVGDVAVVAGTLAQAMVVDISDPTNPSYLGYAPVGMGRDVVPLDESRAAIGVFTGVGGTGVLATIDVADVETTPSLGRYMDGARLNDAQLHGNHLFGLVGGAGFEIWDVSESPLASLVGAYAGYGFADFSYSSIGTDGETAVLTAVYDPGLGGPVFLMERVDVSDPANPVWTGIRTTTPKPNANAQVVDGTAWVVSESIALVGWDVTSHFALTSSAIATGGLLNRFEIRGGLAYASGSGLEVFDVSVPAAAASIGFVPVPGGSRHIALKDDWAYLAGGSGILTVVHVSDPTVPTIASSLDLSAYTSSWGLRGLHAEDSFVYVPTQHTIQVVDVSDPFAPVRVTEFSAPEPGRTETVLGINGALGLFPSSFVAPLQCGAQATSTVAVPSGLRMSVQPNPFRDDLSIRFSTRASGVVRVDVVDIRGRLVKRVARETKPSGSHAVRWDGRDQVGVRAAPGVYFLRLETGDGTASQRAVHVR